MSLLGESCFPSAPHYFSGTGCEVDGTAVPASGYLTHAQLCVADTVVKEYWDTGATGCPSPVPTDGSVTTNAPNTHSYSAPLKALFDSTHFLDSTMIVLKLKVWDSNGGYYDGAIQGPSYNKAYVLMNNTTIFENDLPPSDIALQLQYVNQYTATPSTSMHKIDILNVLPSLTAFYLDSHGVAGIVGDCYAQPDSDDSAKLFAGSPTDDIDDVGQPTISKKICDKSSGQFPPYNFVFLNACETSEDHQLANAFLGTGSTADRAEVGFILTVLADDGLTNWSREFFNNLVSGQTVFDAVLNSSQKYEITGTYTDIMNHDHDVLTAPKIIGDKAMKLHWVYGSGYHTLYYGPGGAAEWHRPL